MKDGEAIAAFYQKELYQACLIFFLLPLNVAITKIYFLHDDIW